MEGFLKNLTDSEGFDFGERTFREPDFDDPKKDNPNDLKTSDLEKYTGFSVPPVNFDDNDNDPETPYSNQGHGDLLKGILKESKGLGNKPKQMGDISKASKHAKFGCDVDLDPGSRNIESSEDINLSGGNRVQTHLLSTRINEELPQFEVVQTILKRLKFETLAKMAGDIIITNPSTDSQVKTGTLDDPRLGTMDRSKKCGSCKQSMIECPGHIGIIRLPSPRLDKQQTVIRRVISILNCTCGECGTLKMSPEMIKETGILNKKGSNRLAYLEKKSKDLPCSKRVSGTPQGVNIEKCRRNLVFLTKASVDNGAIMYHLPNDEKRIFMMEPEDVFEILNAISDEDAKLMGFVEDVHPRDLMIRGIPVIPVCSRPPSSKDGKMTPSGITKSYTSILKDIQELENIASTKGKKSEKYKDKLKQLDFNIAKISGAKKAEKGSKPVMTKSVKDLIQGKAGIPRRQLQGKRSSFSARTVFSTDPNLKVNQVGVPKYIARHLTQRETVTPENIDRLRTLLEQDDVINIYKKIPSRPTLKKIIVTEEAKKIADLALGDQVDRSLQNGDHVIFNRAPSLSRHSMMSAEAVITDRLTLDLHLAHTTPLNADFDGDEGALHAPQSEDARDEVKNLMSVKNCVISNQTNAPNLAVTFDSIAGCYLLTEEDRLISPDLFSLMVERVDPPVDLEDLYRRGRMHHVPIDTGKLAFSMTLPRDLFYQEEGLNIQNGILVEGRIRKKHIGYGHNTIVQAIFKSSGREEALNFLTSLYRICYVFLQQEGLSVGIGDCAIGTDQVDKLVEADLTRARMTLSEIVPTDDPRVAERDESEVIAILNRSSNFGTSLIKEVFSPDNALATMITSGAKGSTTNAALISGMLGQTLVNNKRPEPLLKGKRCAPMFAVGDNTPEARGFCTSSFAKGLSPTEMFFHALNTREGIVSTSINTAFTGATNHSLMKSLEDPIIDKRGAVITSGGHIVEDVYGRDGLNPMELETVRTPQGKIPTFLNLERAAGIINTKFGYTLVEGVWKKKE